MALTDKQRAGIKGEITGAIITIVVLSAGIAFIPTSLTPDSTVGERLAFTLKADILVIVWLARCIGMIGRHRFHTPEDIDGAGLTTGTPQAKVLQATLQNTLEQAVLAIVVHLIWAVVMPVSWISGVLAGAGLFFVGRLLFIRRYEGGGPSRALGFALTFYPSIVMLLITIIMIVVRLVT